MLRNEAVDGACTPKGEQKTPRLSRRRESLAENPSTAFSQEIEAGVKLRSRADGAPASALFAISRALQRVAWCGGGGASVRRTTSAAWSTGSGASLGRTGLVLDESLDAALRKALLLTSHSHLRSAGRRHDCARAEPTSGEEDDPSQTASCLADML